jgi:regulatory protein
MNDIVSLESVRREREQLAPADPGRGDAGFGDAGDETEAEDREAVVEKIGDTVVRALGRRQLSIAETTELLIGQGATDDEAGRLVERYQELGYLNDVALAETLVERLTERSHKSRAIIARELSARQLPRDVVDEALGVLDDQHELDLAVEAALTRIRQLASYDDQTAERRLSGFLARRGFPSSVVREASRQAMATRVGGRSASGPRFR